MERPRCPNCSSSDTLTFQAAYAAGARSPSTSDGTHFETYTFYMGTKEKPGVDPAFGTKQARQARIALPPRRMTWGMDVFGYSFVYALLAAIAAFVYLIRNPAQDVGSPLEVLSVAWVLTSAVTGVALFNKCKQYNETIYSQKLYRWMSSYVCERCTTILPRLLQPDTFYGGFRGVGEKQRVKGRWPEYVPFVAWRIGKHRGAYLGQHNASRTRKG